MINHDEIYAQDLESGSYVSEETERLALIWELNEEGDLTGKWATREFWLGEGPNAVDILSPLPRLDSLPPWKF